MDCFIKEVIERNIEQLTNHIHTILKCWTCNRKGCHNHAKYCFFDSINGGKYLPIDSDNVHNWNTNILSRKTTIEIPSDHVHISMLSKVNDISSKKMRIKPQQEPTIIINNHMYLNLPRYSYQSVQYSNS